MLAEFCSFAGYTWQVAPLDTSSEDQTSYSSNFPFWENAQPSAAAQEGATDDTGYTPHPQQEQVAQVPFWCHALLANVPSPWSNFHLTCVRTRHAPTSHVAIKPRFLGDIGVQVEWDGVERQRRESTAYFHIRLVGWTTNPTATPAALAATTTNPTNATISTFATTTTNTPTTNATTTPATTTTTTIGANTTTTSATTTSTSTKPTASSNSRYDSLFVMRLR